MLNAVKPPVCFLRQGVLEGLRLAMLFDRFCRV